MEGGPGQASTRVNWGSQGATGGSWCLGGIEARGNKVKFSLPQTVA